MHAVHTEPPLSAAEFAVAHNPAQDPDLRRTTAARFDGDAQPVVHRGSAVLRRCRQSRRHCDLTGTTTLRKRYPSADARNG
jgi:hypothetical protein